ncbi:Phosphoglucosamine mutase [Actinidia chinensis var. chinensis]|uniref:Phosphoglucosamine mutase n=1 Tax=Actinidia chinensis var. chinensis TaxID=1590841 RepID=A0A2R6RK45_ACTCC|nr:Phosphoglucosamine mutase [Actinidia chinensis var. chinensis]
MWYWVWNWFSSNKEPPPPMVVVPPLFDFPPLAARTRMLESSYNLLFGKLALRSLFQDYFEEARHFSTRIMLKPIDDPHVDLIATVSGPLDQKPEEKIIGNAQFRWQSDVDDPHTFVDLFVSSTDPILLMRSCAYYPKYGFGAFGIYPVLLTKRVSSEDYGVMGLRYGSSNLSLGATLVPFSSGDELPKSAWLVSKMGRLTAGVQYEPYFGSKDGARYKNLANWSCAIGYGLGSGSPLTPSFNFGLELAKSSQFIASFYQHVVVQRRVKNPLEENEVVGITNYIDFGFELQTRVDDDKTSNVTPDSTFQVAASWQANKNLLLKGKVGPLSSSVALAFKSWWKPSFTFSISATRDRTVGKTAFGFGIRVDNVREASYQRADPNFVMLTPNKEHLAEGIHWKIGKRPVLQSDINSGNFEGIPRELRPLGKIL